MLILVCVFAEELRVQQKQYNTIVNEQRVLNQQLIERNQELAALYEKLKLQNSMLTKVGRAFSRFVIAVCMYLIRPRLLCSGRGGVQGEAGAAAQAGRNARRAVSLP